MMTKKLTSLVLALVMCLSLCIPAFATDTNPQSENQEISDNLISPRAHDVDEKRVEVNRVYAYNVDTGRAGGQQYGPYKFPAGYFFSWTDGGNSASVSVDFAWGPVNVSVPMGNTRFDTGSVGFGGPVPANEYFYIHVFRDFAYVKYAVYERPSGTSYDWSFRRYEYATLIIGSSARPVTGIAR